MAIANLLIKIGADISELKTGADSAVRAVERTSAKIDAIGSAISKTLLGAFSVTAVVAWADRTITAASRVDDLSKKLKVSTDALQRWDYTMNLSGGSIEDIDTALGFMNKTLGGGGTGVIKALNDVGLSFDEIRKMSPEQAFETIVTAIGNIKDPMAQAAAQIAIFGRSGGALFAAMSEGFVKTGQGAAVMSAETIRRLDAAGDAWTRLGNKATVISGELIASLFQIFDQPANEEQYAHKFFDPLHLDVQRAIDDLKDLNKWLHVLSDNTPKAPGAPGLFGPGRGAVPIELSAADTRDIENRLNRVRKSLDEGAKAADAQRQRIDELARSYRGMDVVSKANDAIKAVNQNLKAGFSVAQMTTKQQDELNDVLGEAIDVYHRLGQSAPKAMLDLYAATIRVPPVVEGITAGLLRMTQQVKASIPEVQKFGDEFKVVEGIPFGGHIGEQVDLSILKVKKAVDNVDDLARAFAQMAQVSGGAFGEVLQGIGSIITSLDAAKKGIDSIRIGESKGGSAGLLDMATGYLALAGAAVQAGKALRPLLGLHHGKLGDLIGTNRDARIMVENFAALYGGFDKLHEKLLELGPAGEQMWIQLTQKVDSGKIEQAKAAIDSINTAFDKQQQQLNALNEAMNEYGFTWEDLGEKARGARLADLFTELYDKTQILKDAGIDYHEILLRQSSDYSELVQAAIRTGTEIPASMRPVLEDLIEMGTLVDENGQSFKDLSQVTWAKTLTQGFDQVTQAIYDLTDALTHGVGGALDELGRRTVRIPIKFDVDNTPGGGSVPEFATGTRGQFRNFGAGQYVKLHGYEKIVTEAESLGVSDGGMVTLSAPDALKLLHGEIVTVTRKDAARGGLRPRAGSGRSY